MNAPDNWLEEAEASQAIQMPSHHQQTKSADDLDADKPLNAQQMRFVDEYRRNGERNAASAYLRAGYECASMSIASAAASRLLKQVNVKTELKRRRDEDRRLARMSEESFKAEVMRRFMARPADYIDMTTGELREGLSSDDLAAISDVEIKTEYTLTGKTVTIKSKTESRAKYAELAMRLNGWGLDNINVNMSQTPTVIRDTIPDISPDALPGFLAGLTVAETVRTSPDAKGGDDDASEAVDDA